jgi:UDP-glucose 4-epimerase
MRCTVTGAAGFIGSHLSRQLLQEGFSVTGIDSYSDYYPRWIKETNIQPLVNDNNFTFISGDINSLDLSDILGKSEIIFHLAAQAGVRASWGESFSVYTKDNIEATQKLLEEAKDLPIKKFVFASSSSVYGHSPELPMSETSRLFPYSPYGVTKLAAENLCYLYYKNYGVPTVSLRFFTVYGPGQRPDMAFHKFLKCLIDDKPLPIFGDGKQTRDFTFVDDIIKANIACIDRGKPGETYNIGGGNRAKLEDLFPVLEDICQKKIPLQWENKQKGDVPHTLADIRKAQNDLGYSPGTDLRTGLSEEWDWIQSLYSQEG